MKASLFLNSIIALLITQLSLYASQSNILWHNSTTGAVKFMPINNTIPENTLSVVDSSNTNLLPKGMGDFTGDGKADILFHNQNSGNLRIWEMDGTTKVNNIQVLGSSNTNLKIAGIGDFDGDGDNDIATFNTNSGALRMWVMEGTVRVDNISVLTGANVNLVPRGAGDMDGDGIPDIVLRNNNSGAVRVWTMNDDFIRKGNEYVTGSSNTNLELRGVMDINGDGNNDILNYNTNTGKLRAWLMDGSLAITENAEIFQEGDLGWSVRGGSSGETAILDNNFSSSLFMIKTVNENVPLVLVDIDSNESISYQYSEEEGRINAFTLMNSDKEKTTITFNEKGQPTSMLSDNVFMAFSDITDTTITVSLFINGEMEIDNEVIPTFYLKDEQVGVSAQIVLNKLIKDNVPTNDASQATLNWHEQLFKVLVASENVNSIQKVFEKHGIKPNLAKFTSIIASIHNYVAQEILFRTIEGITSENTSDISRILVGSVQCVAAPNPYACTQVIIDSLKKVVELVDIIINTGEIERENDIRDALNALVAASLKNKQNVPEGCRPVSSALGTSIRSPNEPIETLTFGRFQVPFGEFDDSTTIFGLFNHLRINIGISISEEDLRLEEQGLIYSGYFPQLTGDSRVLEFSSPPDLIEYTWISTSYFCYEKNENIINPWENLMPQDTFDIFPTPQDIFDVLLEK